jgi:hypothetical protein
MEMVFQFAQDQLASQRKVIAQQPLRILSITFLPPSLPEPASLSRVTNHSLPTLGWKEGFLLSTVSGEQ